MSELLFNRKKEDTTKIVGDTLPPDLLAHLSKFLPTNLQANVEQVPPSVRALKEAIQHLESLYHTIGTYLPDHLRAPDTAYEGGRLWSGSFLSADVSGFTTLFEKLSVLGDEGAELLTDKMNDYFYTMLDILSRSNGIMMKFAGDALLAFFPRPEPKSRNPLAKLLGDKAGTSTTETAEDVLWAVRAALRMQRAMGPFTRFETKVGPGSLSMRVGISSGNLFAAHVGTSAQRDYMILGDLTAQAMETESAGEAGEVIVDEAALDLMGDQFRTTEISPGLYRVEDDLGDALGDFESSQPTRRRGSRYTTIDSNPLDDLKTVLARVETLAAFIPTDLLKLLVESGEKRAIGSLNRPKTAVIFTHVTGPAELLAAWGNAELPRIADMLSRYYIVMQRAIARYGGSLTRTDPYKTGDKLLATFGAPIKHYDDPERAVSAALAMHTELDILNAYLRETCPPELRERAPDPDVFITHRVGITQGDVLGTEVGVGQTGRGTRREYTVMGDDVNLAARLMSKAEMSTTLVNDKIWDEVSYRFEAESLEPIRVKGKTAPIAVFNITGEKAQVTPRLDTQTPFIGREASLQTILDAVEAMLDAKSEGQIIAVDGEIGVGKSRLLHEVIENLEERRITLVQTTCVAYVSFYRPWIDVVTQLLSLAGIPAGEQRAHLEAQLEALGTPETLSPLAALLNLPAPPQPEALKTEPDDAEAEAATPDAIDTPDAITSLLQVFAKQQPVILVIDDMHHADTASLRVMQHLREKIDQMPLLVLFAIQPDLSNGQPETLADTVIHLNDLTEDGAADMAKALLQANTMEPELEKLVWQHSQGRPLFVEVLVRGLQRYKGVRVTPKRKLAKLTEDAEPDMMPSTTRAMVLSRIDRLPVAPREALLAASVLGDTFTMDALTHIHEDDDLADMEALVQEGLLVANKLVKGRYHFANQLTQIVAYNSLPNSRRRELHEDAGDYWASYDNPSLMQLTERAYHHTRCGDPFKAVEALRLARDRARQHSANEQAITFCRQIPDHAQGIPELFSAYQEAAETLGDLYAEQEQYAEATAAYEPAVQAVYEAYMSVLCRQALVTLAADPIVAAMSLTRALTLADKAAPVRPWLQAALAWLLWRRGAHEAAAEYCRSEAGTPDASGGGVAALLDYVYGLVSLNLGDEKTARAHLQGTLDAWQEQQYEAGVALAQQALEGDTSGAEDDISFLRVLLTLYFELNAS